MRQDLHPAGPLHSADALAAAVIDAQRHIGAVFSTVPAPPGTELRIAFHLEPDERSPVVALYRATHEGTPESGLRVREEGLESALSRIGHEEYGFLTHAEAGAWVEATYAFTLGGEPRRGWARPAPPEVLFSTLLDTLRYCGGYLVAPSEVDFFLGPGGSPAHVPAAHPVRATTGEDHLTRKLEVLGWTELEAPGTGPPTIWIEVKPSQDPDPQRWWLRLRTEDGDLQLSYEAGHCSPSLATGR